MANKNKIKTTAGEKVFDIFNVLFMLFIMIICLYPMLHVLFASFSNGVELMKHQGLLLWPAGFSTEAYSAVARNAMIPRGYMVTLFVVFVGTTLNIIMSCLGAYFLARNDQAIGKAAMIFIVITMFFSGGMIPGYLNVRSLGLYDSIWALIFPVALNTFNMIILKTNFMSIPASLEESAKLDGAGHGTILFKIFVPLSKATLAVLVLYYGVAHWNSWFNAMMYIQNRELYPLQLILREILIVNDTSNMTAGNAVDVEQVSDTIKYAVVIVTTLPILAIYPFLQKYFVKGVMVGAVKG